MKDVYIEAFNNQKFNGDGSESAILTNENHNPPNLIFQHLPIRDKV